MLIERLDGYYEQLASFAGDNAAGECDLQPGHAPRIVEQQALISERAASRE